MLGCCLLLPAGVAGASQLPSFAPSLPATAGTRGGVLPATADNDSDALVPSRRHNPLLVAEQDGGRRQDMSAVAVLYPDIGEPYRSIFAEILDGIQGMASSPVASYAIGPASDVTDLNGQLKRNGTKVVIALGRQGLKAAAALDASLSIVAGGVISAPDSNRHSLTGISLTPDPGLLFARLKSLMPEARRVIVIYDPQNNEWLLELAREAARAQGLELVAHQARDLASAARLYQSAFAAADSRHDAVWLPQDATTVDENTILPLVLREAWNRGVPVFSSSLLHVRKGVLFALYPDNVELGRALGHDAEAVLGGDSHRGMLPLRAVLTAVNLRTASHMGLNIGYQQQRSFDMIFPEP
jgi:putative ABC transport system substrate-binding protein